MNDENNMRPNPLEPSIPPQGSRGVFPSGAPKTPFKLEINTDDDDLYSYESGKVEEESLNDLDVRPLGGSDDGMTDLNQFASTGGDTAPIPSGKIREVRMKNPNDPPPDEKKAKKRAKKDKEPGNLRGCLKSLIYMIVIVGVSLALSFFLIMGLNDMFGLVKESAEIDITITENMTRDELVDLLTEKEVVKQPTFFKLYLMLTKSEEKVDKGTYTINTDYDYMRLISSLRATAPERKTVRVTFPEGYTIKQIAETIAESKICTVDEFMAALHSETYNYSLVNLISRSPDRNEELEGYLFTASYDFYVDEEPASMIKKMLNKTEKMFDEEMRDRAKELEMTPDEVLILASIIQKEAYKQEDMVIVSSVFHNRLTDPKLNLPRLQSDVTKHYGTAAYDTYEIEGLPPGPVCNPSLEAISAALYPEQSNYAYFVTDVEGKYYYAKTYKEHQKNIAEAKKVGDQVGGIDTQEDE